MLCDASIMARSNNFTSANFFFVMIICFKGELVSGHKITNYAGNRFNTIIFTIFAFHYFMYL
jgi:hypothetical protein